MQHHNICEETDPVFLFVDHDDFQLSINALFSVLLFLQVSRALKSRQMSLERLRGRASDLIMFCSILANFLIFWLHHVFLIFVFLMIIGSTWKIFNA